jgi:DNA-binding NarL/FixJ family response regulator
MDSNQKQRIEHLRTQGESYAFIAKELGISVNTIKSYYQRNNLGAAIKKE